MLFFVLQWMPICTPSNQAKWSYNLEVEIWIYARKKDTKSSVAITNSFLELFFLRPVE